MISTTATRAIGPTWRPEAARKRSGSASPSAARTLAITPPEKKTAITT